MDESHRVEKQLSIGTLRNQNAALVRRHRLTIYLASRDQHINQTGIA
jgi:hypothetical protein